MSFRTLSSMVAAATQEAERHIKMASAADAIGTTDFDIQKLAEDGLPPEATDDKKKAKAKEEKDEKEGDKEKKSSIDYAFKLAEALRIAAPMVEKLAEQSPLDAPGPQVMASQQVGSQQLPKPPKAKTDPGKSGVGATGTLETNAKDLKSMDWTKNKEASSAFVQAKLAQAELLAKLGHAEAADHILSKLAQDPSSPQPVLPPNSGSAGALQLMPDVPSGRVPESAQGIAAMTRASAKDPTTRTVTDFIQEAPKKDNMVAPTQMTATGLKVSHVVSGIREKQSSLAALGGLVPGAAVPLAALGAAADAPKGRKFEGAVRGGFGSLGGAVGGGMIGGGLGALISPAAVFPAATIGALAGSSAGAHMLSRKTREAAEEHEPRHKKSSTDILADLKARG